MNRRPCTQEKCIYNSKNGIVSRFCPVCADCGAESNVIDEDCPNCWNCMKDEGYVREGRPKFQIEAEKIIIEEKPIRK